MSELTQNPFKAITGWFWLDERGQSHGPHKTQFIALQAMLDYYNPPAFLVKLARRLTDRN